MGTASTLGGEERSKLMSFMNVYLAVYLAVAVVAITPQTELVAQQAASGVAVDAPKVASAIRAVRGAPELDGVLDDQVWARAPVATDFIQRDPDEGEPGTERTEVRVVYTDAALYVGVRAFDSNPEQIAAQLTRRDESSPSDWIGVQIDSYHDRRTAFQFSVNPAGVKRDSYLYDDNNSD
ncbi:MAG: carbohydrate binding family 9 domain-containing protein, partial [Gemmatimonadales bacterium]